MVWPTFYSLYHILSHIFSTNRPSFKILVKILGYQVIFVLLRKGNTDKYMETVNIF